MVLPIFPVGSLSESVVTTVWIGVFVLCLLNLRLGWTLSGLVIPGYIVPLLMVKPLSALVVFCEGILTYLIVYNLANFSVRSGLGCNFFGRDRFFALVLTSICVRVGMDGYFLPWLVTQLDPAWLVQYDLKNSLHSFGLIIISLIANQFWKPGFRRGLTPVVTVTAVTYVIVKYVLLEWTNFSMGSFQFMYEDMASSVLASPKAYIVLIITSFISSRLNLVYSWDFNGILIPSLIAIQWYEPLKVLTSFVEAWFIFIAAGNLLKLKWFKETTIEGARKVIFFFNVSFAYKMILGHVLGRLFPGLQVSDCFGFGYLLPSLLAMKMHDKGIPVRITRTTLQASIVGALVAGLIGFGLTFLPQTHGKSRLETVVQETPEPPVADGSGLVGAFAAAKVLLYTPAGAGSEMYPGQPTIDAFLGGLRSLRAQLMRGGTLDLVSAQEALEESGYALRRLENGVICLVERAHRGWGTFFINPRPSCELLVEVPAPREEWATAESGAYFFQILGARGLALGGPRDPREPLEGIPVLRRRRTLFECFHRVFSRGDVLQVRGYGVEVLKSLYGIDALPVDLDEPDAPSSLWVQGALPPGLRLAVLSETMRDVKIEWREPGFRNVLREDTGSGFAELFLRRSDRKRLRASWVVQRFPGSERAGVQSTAPLVPQEENIQEWLLEQRSWIGRRGTNRFVRCAPESLLFLDEEVVKPIVRVAMTAWKGALTSESLAAEVEGIAGAALAFGYQVWVHEEHRSREKFLVLGEPRTQTEKRYWGTYVWRLGPSRPFLLCVPHPVYEENTLEYAVAALERMNAAAIAVAGSHPKCNTDGSADVVLFENKRSMYNLVHQVMFRETGDEPFCSVHIRALGYRQGIGLPDADALLSFSDASSGEATLGPLSQELTQFLKRDQITVKFVDGSRSTAGYEVLGSAQALYLSHTLQKECCAVWLSPFLRQSYRMYSERSIQEAQFAALGVKLAEKDLEESLAAALAVAGESSVPDGLTGLLAHYRVTQDINSLYSASRLWPYLKLVRVVDRATQQCFLMIEGPAGLLPIVTSLTPPLTQRVAAGEVRASGRPTNDQVRRFIESGATFLKWSEGP